ncbi:sensor histidine kinase, partial [Streptomyces sp. A7024]|nr:sensor histidine kinase [Streptomyces coryli]
MVAWRRRFPLGSLVVLIAVIAPYHMMDNTHMAPSLAAMISIYSLAVAGPRRRTLIAVPLVLMVPVAAVLSIDPHELPEMGRTAGWILLPPLLGEAVRVHRNYIRAIVERAERAERTREEVAARRVAEERLRIARDLHDLLAHSITVIGVQTSVAAHVLVADPDRLDRTALASSLDAIADTCRDARQELRTTLKVLRTGELPDAGGGANATAAEPPDRGPLPGLAGLTDLAEAARAAGAEVQLALDGAEPAAAAPDAGVRPPVPPAVGAAAYR